jgi:hypothetical protein
MATNDMMQYLRQLERRIARLEATQVAGNGETYTITNDSTDRVYDANTVVVAELADVVATLIRDLAVSKTPKV